MILMFHPFIPDSAIRSVSKILKSKWIGQGALVDEFEDALKKELGIPYLVAVNSSSSAIRLALSMIGVRPGDEIITTPLTCTLTNHPILETFAAPVFADIQPDSGNIDPQDIEKRITKRTKAIVCTHWGGMPADLDEIHAVASTYSLPVIEDASEALGATYRGKSIGAISQFTAFSFQAIQLLTTGEGGALAVRSKRHERQATIKRWYGIDRTGRKKNDIGYYDFDITENGFGYHFTNIAAAIGIETIPLLHKLLKHRRNIVQLYYRELKSIAGMTLPRRYSDRESSCHFFTVRVKRRRDFCRAMAGRGIEVSIVHSRNDAYSVFGKKRKDLPNLDIFDKEYIALPTHVHLSDEDVQAIIASVKKGW